MEEEDLRVIQECELRKCHRTEGDTGSPSKSVTVGFIYLPALPLPSVLPTPLTSEVSLCQ